MSQNLDSATTQEGDSFAAVLDSDILVDGSVVLRKGTAVTGHVDTVHEAAQFKGNSLLIIQLTSLQDRGTRTAISTDAFSKAGNGRGKNSADKIDAVPLSELSSAASSAEARAQQSEPRPEEAQERERKPSPVASRSRSPLNRSFASALPVRSQSGFPARRSVPMTPFFNATTEIALRYKRPADPLVRRAHQSIRYHCNQPSRRSRNSCSDSAKATITAAPLQ